MADVKSAAEIVLARVAETPLPPITPTGPAEPPFLVPADWPAVVARSKCIGGSLVGAGEQLARELAGKVEALQATCPRTHAFLVQSRADMLAAFKAYRETAEAFTEAVGQIESMMIAQGSAFRQIHAEQAALDDATAKLASPDSVNLTGEQLLVLKQRVEHAPGIIAGLKETAATLGIEIRLEIEAHEINFDALMQNLAAKAKAAGNTEVGALLHSGWLSFPE